MQLWFLNCARGGRGRKQKFKRSTVNTIEGKNQSTSVRSWLYNSVCMILYLYRTSMIVWFNVHEHVVVFVYSSFFQFFCLCFQFFCLCFSVLFSCANFVLASRREWKNSHGNRSVAEQSVQRKQPAGFQAGHQFWMSVGKILVRQGKYLFFWMPTSVPRMYQTSSQQSTFQWFVFTKKIPFQGFVTAHREHSKRATKTVSMQNLEIIWSLNRCRRATNTWQQTSLRDVVALAFLLKLVCGRQQD